MQELFQILPPITKLLRPDIFNPNYYETALYLLHTSSEFGLDYPHYLLPLHYIKQNRKLEQQFLDVVEALEKQLREVTPYNIFVHTLATNDELAKKLFRFPSMEEKILFMQRLKQLDERLPFLNAMDLIQSGIDASKPIQEELQKKIRSLKYFSLSFKHSSINDLLILSSQVYHHSKVIQEMIMKGTDTDFSKQARDFIESLFAPETFKEQLINKKRKLLGENPLPRKFDFEKLKTCLPEFDVIIANLSKEISEIEMMKEYVQLLLSKISEMLQTLLEDDPEEFTVKQSFLINKSVLEMELNTLNCHIQSLLYNIMTLNSLSTYLYPYLITEENLSQMVRLNEEEILNLIQNSTLKDCPKKELTPKR